MSGYVPEIGERVVIQTQVVEIFQYRPESDQLIYVTKDGAASNYITAHISNTVIEQLDAEGNLVVNADEKLKDAHKPDGFTTNGSPEETKEEGAERTTTLSAVRRDVQSTAGDSRDEFVSGE